MAEVAVERRGLALWLTIDREAQRNALNDAVLAGLRAGLAQAGRDGVRAVVLTGRGHKVFCAGGDLKPSAEGDPFRTDPAQLDNPFAIFLRELDDCPVPTIARVNGHAMGGGFGLACACDIAIGVEGARLGTPEAKIGIFPLMILPPMLRVMNRRKLQEICLTGETMSAEEAVAAGVLTRAVLPSDLDGAVDALVDRLAAAGPTAHRFGRRALATIGELPYRAGLEYAQRLLPTLSRTEEAIEGFAAFNARRPPFWAPQ